MKHNRIVHRGPGQFVPQLLRMDDLDLDETENLIKGNRLKSASIRTTPKPREAIKKRNTCDNRKIAGFERAQSKKK